MFFTIHYIQKFFLYIVLKTYSYKIEKKEEKLKDLRIELKYETDNYRNLLYSAKWWLEEKNNLNKQLPLENNIKFKRIQSNKK